MTLTVKDLTYRYAKTAAPVLQGISFTAESGDFLSVLGANGAGKSTLFRCLLGGLTDYTGAIALDGRDVRTLSRRETAEHIAYIPQIHRPTFGYSVLDTTLMGLTRQLSPFRSPTPEMEKQAMDALEQMGVAQLAERNFATLSGGEQQLVLIARALCQRSDILVMDEPTSSLDYGNQLRVLERVRQLARQGYTVLLSTHDPQHALRFSQKVLALSRSADAEVDPAAVRRGGCGAGHALRPGAAAGRGGRLLCLNGRRSACRSWRTPVNARTFIQNWRRCCRRI